MRGCPICGGAFSVRRVSEYSYETCAGCHGVWMSWHTLSGMALEVDPKVRLAAHAARTSEGTRSCPDCQQPMQKSSIRRILVDYCAQKEHGVWFDGGELRQVLERLDNDDPPPAELPSNFRSLLGDFFSLS